MSRHLLSLLLAATLASVAATAVALGGPAAEADESYELEPVQPTVLPTDAPSTTAPAATPRVVVPQRDLDIQAAPAPRDDAPPPRTTSSTGELLAAAGTSQDPLDRGGRVVRFSVEVEADTGLDPDAVAVVVEEALYDERSWARDHDLRRVAPSEAELHVVIATPLSTDRLCARVGLDTVGWLSCWTRDTAAINVDRWTDGVGHVEDLALYRRYVVNHEVGHGLGYGHRDCPGRGELAPLMQQQTKSLQGCVANEWQYP